MNMKNGNRLIANGTIGKNTLSKVYRYMDKLYAKGINQFEFPEILMTELLFTTMEANEIWDCWAADRM